MAEHPNVARLKKGYEAFANGDFDTLRELFDENIVWHVPGNNPIAGDYKGIDEVFGFFARIAQETQGKFGFDIHAILADDEHAVALIKASAERNGTRIDAEPGVHAYHINADGKVTEFWGFTQDTTKADDFWS